MFGFAKGQPNEDRLTAAVFGLMRYLPPQEWLHPFMEQVGARHPELCWDPNRLPEEHELLPWPVSEIPESMRRRFAKTSDDWGKGRVIPDAAIRLHWVRWGDARTSRRVTLFIEAEHSKTVEAEQLAQQWAVLSGERTPGEERFILLVNPSSTLPWPESTRPTAWEGEGSRIAPHDLRAWSSLRAHYLRTGERLSALDQLPETDRLPLLHFPWAAIAALVRRLRDRSWPYQQVFDGLLEYLASAGYTAPLRLHEVVELASDVPILAPLRQRPTLMEALPQE
ncbi:MAG: hypothetical protein H6739_34545 [Alphaproteobacteria bacterium]|nr:hypothetical protein [Alphaproteobacteria bacterium]